MPQVQNRHPGHPANGHDVDDELGLVKPADDAIVARAIAPEIELAMAKRLAKGARASSARSMQEEERFIPHNARDGAAVLTCAGGRFRPAKTSGTQEARRGEKCVASPAFDVFMHLYPALTHWANF